MIGSLRKRFIIRVPDAVSVHGICVKKVVFPGKIGINIRLTGGGRLDSLAKGGSVESDLLPADLVGASPFVPDRLRVIHEGKVCLYAGFPYDAESELSFLGSFMLIQSLGEEVSAHVQSRGFGRLQILDSHGVPDKCAGFSISPVTHPDEGKTIARIGCGLPVDRSLVFGDIDSLQTFQISPISDLLRIGVGISEEICVICVFLHCRVDVHGVPLVPGVDIFQLPGRGLLRRFLR